MALMSMAPSYPGQLNPNPMNPMMNSMMGAFNGSFANANTQYAPLPQTLTRVTGLDGAKAYQMAPNSVVPLFDSNEDIMYIKSTDGAGFPTIKSFAFTEITEKATSQTKTEDFVSREEFESFKKELMNNAEQSISTESANTNGKRKQSNAVN